MQIVCPNCKTSYQIADTAIGENGRTVRCVRCQAVWRTDPPVVATSQSGFEADSAANETVAAFRAELGGQPSAPSESEVDRVATDQAQAEPPLNDMADPGAGAATQTAQVALADIPIPVEDAPALVPAADPGAPGTQVTSLDDNGPPDIESVAARRARTKGRRRRSRSRMLLPAAIAAMVILCVSLIGWRKDVVAHAPQLASFYSAIGLPVNLRGMAFADMKIGNEIHDGVPVLVVEGIIVSLVSKPVEVPRLRLALRSATGAEVYSWTAQPSQTVLGPFETLPFRSRLASPPAEGHDIQVRFFTRRDAVAGLR
jgi:predicted Zn finger-like uncharacterized protein